MKSPSTALALFASLCLVACTGETTESSVQAGGGEAKAAAPKAADALNKASDALAAKTPAAKSPEAPAAKAPAAPAVKTESDRAVKSYLDGMGEIATALKGVTDEASAKQAGSTIQKIGERLAQEKDKWAALSEAELQAATTRFTAELERVKNDVMQAMTGLMMKPELSKHIQEALKNLPTLGQ